MKKLTLIFTLMTSAFLYQAKAQFTNTGNPTTTTDDVGIGTVTPTTGKLTINQTPTIPGQNCTYNKPALSIEWAIPNQVANCNGGMTGTDPNIFQIMQSSYNNMGSFVGYNTPLLTAGGPAQLTVGGLKKGLFDNSFYRYTYFDGNTLFKNKVRITNDATTIASSPNWSNTNFPYSFSVDNGNSRFLGKVEIGNMKRDYVSDPNCIFSVYGDMFAKRIVVQTAGWADYVFAPEFELKPLKSVEEFIKVNKHLPDMPSAEQVTNSGIDMAEMQKMQQAKIEELTLYIIQLQNRLEALENN